ncbi:MAG: hypothetical protein A2787_06935 [Omnitrophica WOR_2 bacterium RIFCSPHIGHO2_01_FULL_48_9]|nr:MAG: hypothetical protein A3D10_03175 [Omnitrophica WOR_2 bacterium RIFCSPHIGHO2_02_FULL_48_11]OGX30362.1 MAG: hypothetical protein A2787_06935 [Omnitrophica WOR_2 bacterium RIFCSPHIGHO2_01_FULL_48_9]
MLRWISALILLCFSIWLIPLGAFIAPSREVKVCGGQRAICLCSRNFKSPAPASAGKMWGKGGRAQKDPGAYGAASHDFILISFLESLRKSSTPYVCLPHNYSSLVFDRLIEPVPKT